MAFIRRSMAQVRNPNILNRSFKDRFASLGGPQYTAENIPKNILTNFDPNKWLLSHVTIVASVDVELANPDDPNSDYLIAETHSEFVNNNGDSWERELLRQTYKSFLGAAVYCEHVQDPNLNKGRILDVALREIDTGKKKLDGTPVTTLYVDILVATSREHKELVREIETGALNAMSMGCSIKYSICSKCGVKAHDETEMCTHILNEKLSFFYDHKGTKRIIAELCGHKDDPDSVTFVESSWVRNPAFPGAILRSLISPTRGEYVEASKDGVTEYLTDLKNQGLIKDTIHHAIPKAASTKVAEGLFPEDSGEEMSPDELTGESSDSMGEDMGDGTGEAPTEEATPVDPVEGVVDTVEGISQEVLDQQLSMMKQEMASWVRDQSWNSGRGPGRGGGNPYVLENDVNDNLIRVACTKVVASELKEKVAVDITSLPVKMASVIALSTILGDFSKVAKVAPRRYVVATVCALHNMYSSDKVGSDIAEYISKNPYEGEGKRPYVMAMALNLGRNLTATEVRKASEWLSI